MARFKTIEDLGNLSGQRVLVRADLNVPMQDGIITDDTRIKAVIPTVKALLDKGAQVLLLSHFGRPKGQRVSGMSLMGLTGALSKAIGADVTFIADCVGETAQKGVEKATAPVLLMENVRFHKGEEANDPAFAKQLASLGNLYVNDAFSAAHRAHASTEGIAHLLPSVAGKSMAHELKALEDALGKPIRPVAAVVGGAKVSSKLDVLTNLVSKVDHLIIGGGMANTFLAAQGVDVGASLCEHDLKDTALEILERAKAANCTIHLPSDLVCAKEFKANADSRIASTDDVADDEMILDVGPKAVDDLITALKTCKTLIWNGPLGAFELSPFDKGTVKLARAAAELTRNGDLLTVAGGGDTVSALAHAGAKDDFSHVSTAGGAFLEWMEGKPLPGVEALVKS